MSGRRMLLCVLGVTALTGAWSLMHTQAALVGRWPFDEGSGTNTVDVSGNNASGTLVGDPLPIWTSGVSSNALGFDGVQNEAIVPNATVLSPTNALTLMTWVRVTTNITSDAIGKWSTNALTGSYILGLTNGCVTLELMLGGQRVALIGEGAALSASNWHHIVGSYDGAAMKVYVDGVLAGSIAASGTVNVGAEPLRVGLLSGQLDDVRLYNHALSTNELMSIYSADTDGDGISDVDEINIYQTNPNNSDTDGDGMPDGWEVQYGLNPLNSADAAGDLDGDGVNNLTEYRQGRDPTKGAVSDTTGLVNLNVFTPLE